MPAEEELKLPYQIRQADDKALGGAVYPFLTGLDREWRLLSKDAGIDEAYLPIHTLGQEMPALRWVNGDKVHDLYVDGMDNERFLAQTGLRLSMEKGGFVLSKRLSRLMRPYFVSRFFPDDGVKIGYLDQTDDQAKVWDGAGLISRQMLSKLALPAELTLAKRKRLERELKRARRVEFTVMSRQGQDKGHAIVAENLRDSAGNPVDFLLPQDTKREISLNNGKIFVGINFVHGQGQMHLDIQSLINLYPFFDEKRLLNWLGEEGELFAHAVQSGEIGEVMGKIDPDATLDDLQRWTLKEYLASGGHPMWFRTHVRSIFNQHLKRLNSQRLTKMRLPIPGGRYYVMPAGVGQRAGRKMAVGRGEIQLDPRPATAWVNDEDWLMLEDSPTSMGIAGILGGADNDDALWLHPFTDTDGEQKILAWRSPNQAGEYLIFHPTPQSAELSWATVDGEAESYPIADSQKLPARIDQTQQRYLNLASAGNLTDLGQGQPYSPSMMESTIQRTIVNRGALGMSCNSLMLSQALFAEMPAELPAPLEQIIDGSVKTGADLSEIALWNYAKCREWLEKKTPIPILLWSRLSVDQSYQENAPPSPIPTYDHWLDRLEQGVRSHIQAMAQRRDVLASQARPPQLLFEQAQVNLDAVQLGRELTRRFAIALATARHDIRQPPIERGKRVVADYLAHFPPAQQRQLLLGALVATYEGEMPAGDVAVWLSGSRGESINQLSIAQQTMTALREIGLLDELVETTEGVIQYPRVC